MEEKDKKYTIEEFLDRNKTRLTGVGIFATLAGFLSSIQLTTFSYLLSFSMLIALILVWSEIDIKTTETEKRYIRLSTFKLFIRISYYLVILYILLQYRLISWFLLFIPILVWMAIKVSILLRRVSKIRKIFDSNKIKDRLYTLIITIPIMLMCIGFSFAISLYSNTFLEIISSTERYIENNFKSNSFVELKLQNNIEQQATTSLNNK